MTDPWFDADTLRGVAGAKLPADQAKFELAASVARSKVRSLCGPVSPPETIVERVRVRVPSEELPLKYRPTSLTSVVDYRSGSALTVGDFDFEDQLLTRKDGGLICDSLTVTYVAGYVGDTNDPIPDDLISMATLIGQQYLRVAKRFRVDTDDPVAGVGFLVPDAAKAVARDYLLAPEGA